MGENMGIERGEDETSSPGVQMNTAYAHSHTHTYHGVVPRQPIVIKACNSTHPRPRVQNGVTRMVHHIGITSTLYMHTTWKIFLQKYYSTNIILIKPTITSYGIRHTNIPRRLQILEAPPHHLMHTTVAQKTREYLQNNLASSSKPCNPLQATYGNDLERDSI